MDKYTCVCGANEFAIFKHFIQCSKCTKKYHMYLSVDPTYFNKSISGATKQ